MLDLFTFDPDEPFNIPDKEPSDDPQHNAGTLSPKAVQPGPLINDLMNSNAPLGTFISHFTKPSLIAQYFDLDPIARDCFQERAAIYEFEAGMPRDEAERKALREIMAKLREAQTPT